MNKRDFNVVGNEGTDNQELAKGIAFIKSRRAELNVVQMVENMRDKPIISICSFRCKSFNARYDGNNLKLRFKR